MLAIDKRAEKYVVVDVDNPIFERSLRYEDEDEAKRYIKLATDFRQDIKVMPVLKLYERQEESPEPPEEVEILKYTCEECGDKFENPLAKARHIKIHKREVK